MTEALFSLVYVSRATRAMERQDLHAILVRSRAHNHEAEITGLLLYGHGNFLQVLEGDQEKVESLYESIRRDERHHHVTTVRTRHEDHRQFPDWKMGFGDLDLDLDPDGSGPLVVLAGDQVDPFGAEVELLRDLLQLFDGPA